MRLSGCIPRTAAIAALFFAVMSFKLPTPASAQTCGGESSGPFYVTWELANNISACPAGDTVFAGKPSRLRTTINVFDEFCVPIAGLPPEDVWVTYTTLTGNLKVNDKGTKIFAEDSTNASGQTRITIPSFSGCGTVRLTLRIQGILIGNKTATVRTVDTTANGRVETDGLAPDDDHPCDVNYSGSITSADSDTVAKHVDHWHRLALHGTLVRRTNFCDTCAPRSSNTYGDGSMSWSPDGRKIVYTKHLTTDLCNAFIIPSDPVDGDTPQQFTFKTDSSDYDTNWSPLGHEIVFHRKDYIIYRKGVPGLADTAEVGIYAGFPGSPSFSPDADSVAFVERAPQNDYVYTIPIVGGSARQLTTSSAFALDDAPDWSPDGRIMIHQRFSDGRNRLHKAATREAPLVNPALYFDAGTDVDARFPTYSPDSLVVVADVDTGRAIGPPSIVATLETAKTPSTVKAITSNYPLYRHASVLPVLSPDGTRLAMTAKDPKISGALSAQVWAVRRNMNLPPQISSVGSKSSVDSVGLHFCVQQGTTDSFLVVASDPESDPLTYSAYFLASWMSFNPTTRKLYVSPGGTLGKRYNVVLHVATLSGGTDVVIARFLVSATCGSGLRSAETESAALDSDAVPEGPNPTRGRFVLATPAIAGATARLLVYDVIGRRVADIRGPAGVPLVWEGKDDTGASLRSGVYFYRLEVAGRGRGGKVVMMH